MLSSSLSSATYSRLFLLSSNFAQLGASVVTRIKKNESLRKPAVVVNSDAPNTLNVKVAGTVVSAAEISLDNTNTTIPSQQLTIDINNPVITQDTTKIEISAAVTVIIPSDEQLEK